MSSWMWFWVIVLCIIGVATAIVLLKDAYDDSPRRQRQLAERPHQQRLQRHEEARRAEERLRRIVQKNVADSEMLEHLPKGFWIPLYDSVDALLRDHARRVRRQQYYGDRHLEERAKYAGLIRESGGMCMERECIMPTRRIRPGAKWHLAHDHDRGGPHDYLGPAHPECNEHEARQRGVTWNESDTSTRSPSSRQQVAPWSEDTRRSGGPGFDPAYGEAYEPPF